MSENVDPFIELLGSDEHCKKLYEWLGSEHLTEKTIQLVEYHNECRREGFGRRIMISFGLLFREYEKENGLSPIKFNPVFNIDFQNMIDCGRSIAAIVDEPHEYNSEGDLKYDFFYTIGNDDHPVRVPEILTFWPYANSSGDLLNKISVMLISGHIKPLHPGESREITGLLGMCGEMPIRLELLSKDGLLISNEKWTCQLRESTPVLLLTLPDLNGNFPGSEEYRHNTFYPANIINNSSSSQLLIPPQRTDWLPLHVGGFAIELRYIVALLNGDEESRLSDASSYALREASLFVQVDDYEDMGDAWDPVVHEWGCFCELGTKRKLEDWLIATLDEFDDEELFKFFEIGSVEDVEVKYKDKRSFVDDIEFEVVLSVIRNAYKSAVFGDETMFRLSLLDNAASD